MPQLVSDIDIVIQLKSRSQGQESMRQRNLSLTDTPSTEIAAIMHAMVDAVVGPIITEVE
jgi:hypothetical protein